ncbi:hypothetical protein SASPL_157838 [Salvia splendens]|uniref:Uncharacterized protein n=1 Tax=Salvia splendens TaxID=180675 RepID=A0A8X8VUA1_SALSN|nr:hypothetical protein SASPL_157838 [Salvia splendens]
MDVLPESGGEEKFVVTGLGRWQRGALPAVVKKHLGAFHVSGAFPMEICEEEKEVLPESGDSTSQDHVVVDSVKSHCRINETRDGNEDCELCYVSLPRPSVLLVHCDLPALVFHGSKSINESNLH